MKLKFLLRCLPDKRLRNFTYPGGVPVVKLNCHPTKGIHRADTLYFTCASQQEVVHHANLYIYRLKKLSEANSKKYETKI